MTRRKLCFTCQEPWVPGHKFAKGKAHYIEVFLESKGEEQPVDADGGYEIADEEQPPTESGKIAVLARVPCFHTLRFKGVV